MLYDVFDVHKRAEGFRWLYSEEIEALQAQREAENRDFCGCTQSYGKNAAAAL
jgi:hypothetical protein